MEVLELDDVLAMPTASNSDGFTQRIRVAGAIEDSDSTDIPRYEVSLAPVDGGFQAWTLLVVAFMIEVLVWGFPNSFGVLLAAYLQDPVYSTQDNATTLLPLIGTLCTGIMYCSSLIIYPTMHWYPRIRRVYTWTGTVLCSVSLIAASFTTRVVMLVAFQGILFAIGGSLVYAPVISYMSEWFVKRRGLANGIVFTGANTGGVLFPLILPPLISRYGVMNTTRGLALCIAVCLVPVLPFMKARLPESRVHGPAPRSSTARTWLLNRNLWFFIAMNTIQGFGFFIPLTWLPTFASSLGLSGSHSSLALTLINGASIFAGFTMGYLSDRFDIWLLAIFSLITTCLATFLIWGLWAYSLAGILAYGIVYGSTAGSWSSMWYGFVTPIAKDDPSLSTTLFSLFLLTRGIGNILSTPISTALQHTRPVSPEAHFRAAPSQSGFAVADGRYKFMILYAGICFAGAAVIALIGWACDRRSSSRWMA